MNWNQPICERCWQRRSPGRTPVRVPVAQTKTETCAYCGALDTRSGIYARDHPDQVPYPKRQEQ